MTQQITYALFLRRLDELQELEENKANRLGTPIERRFYAEEKDSRGATTRTDSEASSSTRRHPSCATWSVAARGDQSGAVQVWCENQNIGPTKKVMATPFGVTLSAVNRHLNQTFEDSELHRAPVAKHYLLTDGNIYHSKHYGRHSTIAVRFKIENSRAVQFRKRAGQVVKNDTIPG